MDKHFKKHCSINIPDQVQGPRAESQLVVINYGMKIDHWGGCKSDPLTKSVIDRWTLMVSAPTFPLPSYPLPLISLELFWLFFQIGFAFFCYHKIPIQSNIRLLTNQCELQKLPPHQKCQWIDEYHLWLHLLRHFLSLDWFPYPWSSLDFSTFSIAKLHWTQISFDQHIISNCNVIDL